MKEKRVTTPLHEHGVRIGGDEERKRARSAKCGVKKVRVPAEKAIRCTCAVGFLPLSRVERGLKDAGPTSRAPGRGWERGERFSRVVDVYAEERSKPTRAQHRRRTICSGHVYGRQPVLAAVSRRKMGLPLNASGDGDDDAFARF